jgi:hypothetical protein
MIDFVVTMAGQKASTLKYLDYENLWPCIFEVDQQDHGSELSCTRLQQIYSMGRFLLFFVVFVIHLILPSWEGKTNFNLFPKN